jgi:hypothetical protein
MATKKSTGVPPKLLTEDSSGPTEPVSRDPSFYADEALDNASIGNCIVCEMHEFTEAILALSRKENLAGGIDYRARIGIIAGLAKRASHHAEDMQGLMESLVEKAQGYVDMLGTADRQRAPKGGA